MNSTFVLLLGLCVFQTGEWINSFCYCFTFRVFRLIRSVNRQRPGNEHTPCTECSRTISPSQLVSLSARDAHGRFHNIKKQMHFSPFFCSGYLFELSNIHCSFLFLFALLHVLASWHHPACASCSLKVMLLRNYPKPPKTTSTLPEG